MDMSDYQLFSKSCSAAASFPQNIVRPFVSQHHLDAFFRRLNEHEKRLFCRDGDAAVDLWEYSSSSRGMINRQSRHHHDHPRGQQLILSSVPKHMCYRDNKFKKPTRRRTAVCSR